MIIDSLGMGGAEVSLKTLSSAMVDLGHNVVVLVIRNDIHLDLDSRVEVNILYYKKYKILPSLYINAIRLRNVVRKLEYKHGCFDLKVANLTLSHKLSHLAFLKDVYYCLHEDVVASNLAKRTGLSRYARERRLRKLFNGKDVITVSDGVKNSLESIEGLRCRSVRTIYNPIDLENIVRLSEEKNLSVKSQYIVHVGRFSTEKRHDLLLEAYSKSCLGEVLVLVGDGVEKGNIIKKICQLNLNNRVVITGFVDNPYPIMRDAKLLVLSSDYEGFGVVLAEAICLGTAVVSTDSKSGPREIMKSSLSDYLVPIGNVAALTHMIEKAVEDVDNGSYPFEDACLERFSPEVIVSKYSHLTNS